MTATAASPPETAPRPRELHGRRLGGLALGALGVVYGDIGTSIPPNEVVELGTQIEV